MTRLVETMPLLFLGVTLTHAAEEHLGIELADTDPGAYLGDRSVGALQPAGPKEVTPSQWFGQSPWQTWSSPTGNWSGARTNLEQAGFTFGGGYIGDGSIVLSGGVHRHAVFRGLVDLNMAFDPKPLLGIEGGTFFAQYLFHHGSNGGADAGDLQGYSNIDADRFSRVGDLWYEQRLLHDILRVKVGQVDANSEFDFVSCATNFINSSAGYSPTALDFPTYPAPDLSANVFIYPAKWLYAGAGVYAGSLREFSAGDARHPYLIGELGLIQDSIGSLGAGRVAAGVWHDSARIERFDGRNENGATGFYAVAEQQVWRKDPTSMEDSSGVSVFAQYGYADREINVFNHHVGFGIATSGIVPQRKSDSCGLYYSWIHPSRASSDNFNHDETALEGFYRFQMTPFLSIQPDIQWINHPGGQSSPNHACVGSLRLAADF